MANITFKIRLGPLVSIDIEGKTCEEISEALEGYEKLNDALSALCSDLAERIYPEGMELEYEEEQKESEEGQKDGVEEQKADEEEQKTENGSS